MARKKDTRPNFDLSTAITDTGVHCTRTNEGLLQQLPVNWTPKFKRLNSSHFAPESGLAFEWKAIQLDKEIKEIQRKQEFLLFRAQVERGDVSDEVVARLEIIRKLKQVIALGICLTSGQLEAADLIPEDLGLKTSEVDGWEENYGETDSDSDAE